MQQFMMSEANNFNTTIQNGSLSQISLQGDAVGLERLIREDALTLDRVSAVTFCGETPLHVAAMLGHLEFARILLKHKPELALELDSIGRVPLHWASEKGYAELVKELLQGSPDACFWRDLNGKIPLHLAVMRGRNDVVIELVRSRPESIREKVEKGGTVLHFCVQYNSVDALKLLVDTPEGSKLVNASDDCGNTIWDLAVIFKQVEIMRYLLSERTDIKKNASNVKETASMEASGYSLDSRSLEMKILLLEAGVDKWKNGTLNLNSPAPATSGCRAAQKCNKWWNKYMTNVEFGLQQARGSILVAATVTASMAFQAGINPPRSYNQAPDQLQKKGSFSYPLLTKIFRSDRLHPSLGFWIYNSKSLVYSLVIIMLVQSGIPIRNKLSNVTLVICMCSVVMSSLLACYYAAKEANLVEEDLNLYIKVFAFMFYLIIVLHVCTFVMSLASKVFNVPKC